MAGTEDEVTAAAGTSPPEAVLVPVPSARRPLPNLPVVITAPLDVALGAAAVVGTPVARVVGQAVSWVAPPVGALLHAAGAPPFLPPAWRPERLLTVLGDRGRAVRAAATYDLGSAGTAAADTLVPVAMDVVLCRTDLTEVVLGQVDLQRVVAAALARLDLTQVVLTQVDLARVVNSALDGLDLTALVQDRVDLGLLVTAALDSIDLTEIVRSRVDLASLADEVIEEVDLPEIIRESSTGVASDVVVGARLGAIDADERVSRLVDRILLRRRARDTDGPGNDTGDRST